jgi:alpha-glucuronidase
MPKTPLMMEFQVTKEYLGFATHLAYLATMWKKALDSDTLVAGEGSTVARIVEGELQLAFTRGLTGMAGVANIGSDRNWSGSHFDQANWYAFGGWPGIPRLSARDIAEEWVRMTFSNDPAFVEPVVKMMMGSREAVVDYMTPLGLAHLMGTGHHYGPAPGSATLSRPEWNPAYYHARAPTASGSIVVLRAATRWRSIRPKSRRVSPTPERRPRTCCCGSTTCRGLAHGLRPDAVG